MKNCKKILLHIAIADAYASASEYSKDEDHIKEVLKFEKYLKHPKHNISPGAYTDDTQMSIGNAHVMLGRQYSKLAFANSWVSMFKKDPRLGYSKKFYSVLKKVKTGQELLDTVSGDSTKNGAAMRSPILGLIKDPKEVAAVAKLQASITHNSDVGIFAGQAAALLAHYSIHTDKPFSEFSSSEQFKLIENNNFFPKNENYNSGEESIALLTINAAYSAICQHNSLMGILEQIIKWGGDTDTIAAIAWGIASARYSEEVLPEFMIRDLEPGRLYGLQYLLDLNKTLLSSFLLL